jgi:hypothetical protein
MDHTPGTPCCVQMSHALLTAGCIIGPKSHRRANSPITTSLGTRYYLLAVDEMKWFLTTNFGVGDDLTKDDAGGKRASGDRKTVLNGRTGILVFMGLPVVTTAADGTKHDTTVDHTELWDVDHMHQRDMSAALFGSPTLLFWDVMITAEA